MKQILSLGLLFWLTATGCMSPQEYAAHQTAKFRQIYPPGSSRGQIQARWGLVVPAIWRQFNPDFSASRPDSGWDSYLHPYVAEKLKDVEARSGKKIESVDRYWGIDESMRLFYCWYFYDLTDKLVDVEWTSGPGVRLFEGIPPAALRHLPFVLACGYQPGFSGRQASNCLTSAAS